MRCCLKKSYEVNIGEFLRPVATLWVDFKECGIDVWTTGFGHVHSSVELGYVVAEYKGLKFELNVYKMCVYKDGPEPEKVKCIKRAVGELVEVDGVKVYVWAR